MFSFKLLWDANEARIADAKARAITAEQRFAAAGDLFARLFAEEKRQRILAAAERDTAVRNLEKAYQDLEVAEANYNLAWAAIDDTAELNAWTQVLNAQTALEDARTGPDEADIQAAEIQVLQAEQELAQVLADQASDPGMAQLTLEQAQLDLEAAQRTLEQLDLIAPIDGTVTTVDAQVGQSAGTTPIIALVNLDQAMVELYLDETDLDKIAVGNEVEVVFDALPDETFSGTVVRVDPELVMVENVPTGNLDSRSAEEIVTILHELHERGRTIVMITHEPAMASHAQRVVQIRDGRVVDGMEA